MDWKKNRLAIAAGVLVVATTGVILASRSRSADSVQSAPTPTLPTFEADSIDRLEVTRPEDDDLVFLKVDGQWRMQQPLDSAADQNAVEQAVEKLAELEVRDMVADDAALHERLGLVVGQALRARALTGDKVALDVWIGPRKDTGTLLRQEGETAVLSMAGAIRYPFTKGTHMYRDRVITDFDPDRVSGLHMQAGEQTFAFTRTLPEGEWAQAEGEKPIEEFDPAQVKSLVASLARLRAANFDAPDTTAAAAGLESPQAVVTLELSTAPSEAEGEGAEVEGEPSEAEAPEAAIETVVLTLGALHDEDKEYSLRKKGSDVPFRISKLSGERLIASPEAFAKKAEPAAPQMPANPHPGPGQPQLPPEVLRQLQQQLGQQQR